MCWPVYSFQQVNTRLFSHKEKTTNAMVKRSNFKVLAFRNFSDYVVDVTFHSYLNSLYLFQTLNDFQIKPGEGLSYRLFYCGQRVKIVCSRPNGTSKNGKPKFERRLLLKRVFNKDTKFVILPNGTLLMKEVNIKEFTEGCFQKLGRQLKIVKFTNDSRNPYHVTFHRTACGKAFPCPRTKALFTVKQGDVFPKVFYDKLYVKVHHKQNQKLAQLLDENSVVCMDANSKDISVEKRDDLECKQELKDQLHQKCKDYASFSDCDNFYKILNITPHKEGISSDLVEKKYAKKLGRKKSRYTPAEITTAYATLMDDKERRCYDNYLDYKNEELFMFEGCVKKRFFNWIWKARRWFSCCRREPPAFSCKTTCARYGCLFVTLWCVQVYFLLGVIFKDKKVGFLRSRGEALAIYSMTFACYFSIKRIFNDNFTVLWWFIMSIVGAVSGILVGFAYFYTLRWVRDTTSATWIHQAAVSAVTGAVISFNLSVLSDFTDICLDGSEDDSLAGVVKRAFYCTLVGAVAGFVLGILSDRILKIKANVVYDDIIMETALDRLRYLMKFIFNKHNGWMCLKCLTREGLVRGCPLLCVCTEHLVRFGDDEMRAIDVKHDYNGVVEKVDDAVK